MTRAGVGHRSVTAMSQPVPGGAAATLTPDRSGTDRSRTERSGGGQ